MVCQFYFLILTRIKLAPIVNIGRFLQLGSDYEEEQQQTERINQRQSASEVPIAFRWEPYRVKLSAALGCFVATAVSETTSMRLNEVLVISCWLSRKHKTDWGLSWSDDLFNLKQAAVGLGPKHQSILRLKQAPVSLKTYFSLIGQLVEACRGALRTYMWAALNDDLCNPREKAWHASERRLVGGLKMISFLQIKSGARGWSLQPEDADTTQVWVHFLRWSNTPVWQPTQTRGGQTHPSAPSVTLSHFHDL